LFQDNKKIHALKIEEFRNTLQGDISINHYYVCLKSLADSLDDVRQILFDETLVLTLVHGHNERYAYIHSFPPF
jgi:hypothetical protein